MSREGEKYHFQKGINIVFGPKYRPLLNDEPKARSKSPIHGPHLGKFYFDHNFGCFPFLVPVFKYFVNLVCFFYLIPPFSQRIYFFILLKYAAPLPDLHTQVLQRGRVEGVCQGEQQHGPGHLLAYRAAPSGVHTYPSTVAPTNRQCSGPVRFFSESKSSDQYPDCTDLDPFHGLDIV